MIIDQYQSYNFLRFITIVCASFFSMNILHGQQPSPVIYQETIPYVRYNQEAGKTKMLNGELAPFYHGVASGDPLSDRVIIWTRVTPEQEGTVTGTWRMCNDTSLMDVVAQGEFSTDADKDYCVKVDVTGLSPGRVYYYGFRALGANSLTGRTMTLPSETDHLRFAVATCSNYQSGYFSAYKHIAERNDLDLVIHLGDYIYEYASTGFGGDPELPSRYHFPDVEILDLADYRARHGLYKMDPDLMRLHQQLPFICVWDDHESANNAYKDGAENHDPATEGAWADRKSASKQSYFEWMPIREQEGGIIYRNFEFGQLADLVMLDTRLEGRVQQVTSIDDTTYYDSDRTILGTVQHEWLNGQLISSDAQWKLLGNQVVFAPVGLGALSAVPLAFGAVADMWEGYPVERDSVIRFVHQNEINNLVVVTGDVHVSFGIDILENPEDSLIYDPATGMGSDAVEIVAPSITSDSWGDFLGTSTTSLFDNVLGTSNPHIKYKELYSHGYVILDITPEKTQADYYYIENIKEQNSNQYHAISLYTNSGENHLISTDIESTPKEDQLPAPQAPAVYTSIGNNALSAPHNNTIISMMPMPAKDYCVITYALDNEVASKIELYDMQGNKVSTVLTELPNKGVFQTKLNLSDLASGSYILKIVSGKEFITRKLEVIK